MYHFRVHDKANAFKQDTIVNEEITLLPTLGVKFHWSVSVLDVNHPDACVTAFLDFEAENAFDFLHVVSTILNHNTAIQQAITVISQRLSRVMVPIQAKKWNLRSGVADVAEITFVHYVVNCFALQRPNVYMKLNVLVYTFLYKILVHKASTMMRTCWISFSMTSKIAAVLKSDCATIGEACRCAALL